MSGFGHTVGETNGTMAHGTPWGTKPQGWTMELVKTVKSAG